MASAVAAVEGGFADPVFDAQAVFRRLVENICVIADAPAVCRRWNRRNRQRVLRSNLTRADKKH